MSAETFSYKGISAGKYIEGEIEAINQEEASFKLKEQKVIITKLVKAKKKKEVKKKQTTSFSFGSGVKTKEILIFAKQFSTMQRAGLPILTSLNLLIEQTQGPNLKKIIIQIKKDLEAGPIKFQSSFHENGPYKILGKLYDIRDFNTVNQGKELKIVIKDLANHPSTGKL